MIGTVNVDAAIDVDLLPIRGYQKDIIETIKENDVAVIIGETGSGKTTQLPQMILDSGLLDECKLKGTIAITQPRRVAAVTVARRVAWERDVVVGEEVGYSVRFEEFSSPRTQIKYLTDGMLLRETLQDELMSNYSVVILDEAHERSLNTDILFGLLKTVLKKRALKGNADSGSLGKLKVLITSATLQGEKFSQYFFNCPVFKVPGRCFPVDVIHLEEPMPSNTYVEYALETVIEIHLHEGDGDILVFMTGQAEIDKAVDLLHKRVGELEEGSCRDLLILPLYAALPPEKQARVFAKAPEGCRRCIISTNVAETSLTVDGIVFVVDTGFCKQKQYDPKTGLDCLQVNQISQVQAVQRSGRAGRTRPGKCYRLYTKENFQLDMENVTVPEIKRISLVGAVLHLKSLKLDIDVLNFDFLDPPQEDALVDALKQLYIIEAIDQDGKITSLGIAMSKFPLEPPLARAVIAAKEFDCVPEVLTIASMLSLDSIFIGGRNAGPGMNQDKPKGLERLENEGKGDYILLLRLYNLWKYDRFRDSTLKSLGLSIQKMKFAKEVRRQLSSLVASKNDQDFTRRDEHPLGPRDTRPICRALLCGFANRLAMRHKNHNGYHTLSDKKILAQLHPSCAHLKEVDDGLLPKWLIYHELVSTSRPFLSKVCPVESHWVKAYLDRIEHVDVSRLSSGKIQPVESALSTLSSQHNRTVPTCAEQQVSNMAKSASARERYLARKQAKALSTTNKRRIKK